ncbi:hypothetical protein BJX70DRAFT_374289 [Aspergillus crustosus]
MNVHKHAQSQSTHCETEEEVKGLVSSPDNSDSDSDTLLLSKYFDPETSILYEGVLEPGTNRAGDIHNSDTNQPTRYLEDLVEVAVSKFKSLHDTQVPTKPQFVVSRVEASDRTSLET